MSFGEFPRGRTAIVGGATYGIGEAPGYAAVDLAALASLKALDMAGLKPQDVDGLFVILPNDWFSHLSLAQYFAIQPKFMDNNRTGGSSFQLHAHTAALALAAGECDVALIAYGSQPAQRRRQVCRLRPPVDLSGALQAEDAGLGLRDRRRPAHASIWRDPRAARRSRPRRASMGEPQSGRIRQGAADASRSACRTDDFAIL